MAAAVIPYSDVQNFCSLQSEESSSILKTTNFEPTNSNQLWKHTTEGYLINKGFNKALYWTYSSGFSLEDINALIKQENIFYTWSFNTCKRTESSDDSSVPITDKLEAMGSRLCATQSDFDSTSIVMQPCISVQPDNACLKFKLPGAEEISKEGMKPNTTCGAGVECSDACVKHVNSTAKTTTPACFSLFLGSDDNVTSY